MPVDALLRFNKAIKIQIFYFSNKKMKKIGKRKENPYRLNIANNNI